LKTRLLTRAFQSTRRGIGLGVLQRRSISASNQLGARAADILENFVALWKLRFMPFGHFYAWLEITKKNDQISIEDEPRSSRPTRRSFCCSQNSGENDVLIYVRSEFRSDFD